MPIIDPSRYGVSFSVKQCRNFGLDPRQTLQRLLDQGWRRFRLMSYWNEHEKQQGLYSFSALDRQVAMIAEAGGTISLCLGVKQPRWPEYHWPAWAKTLDITARRTALLTYVQKTVEHYQSQTAITSYQLENEALLQGFGADIQIDRSRLRQELALVKQIDPTRPVLMSTSNGWGIPVRAPRPDVVGFSCYFRLYSHGTYHTTVQSPLLHRIRKLLIQNILRRPVTIHELQCEPWGHTAIWKMDATEQDKSMSVAQLRHNIAAAQSIGAFPIDLWGGEWWYWRHIQGDDSIWNAVQQSLAH